MAPFRWRTVGCDKPARGGSQHLDKQLETFAFGRWISWKMNDNDGTSWEYVGMFCRKWEQDKPMDRDKASLTKHSLLQPIVCKSWPQGREIRQCTSVSWFSQFSPFYLGCCTSFILTLLCIWACLRVGDPKFWWLNTSFPYYLRLPLGVTDKTFSHGWV